MGAESGSRWYCVNKQQFTILFIVNSGDIVSVVVDLDNSLLRGDHRKLTGRAFFVGNGIAQMVIYSVLTWFKFYCTGEKCYI